jgi:hypothetical protein
VGFKSLAFTRKTKLGRLNTTSSPTPGPGSKSKIASTNLKVGNVGFICILSFHLGPAHKGRNCCSVIGHVSCVVYCVT